MNNLNLMTGDWVLRNGIHSKVNASTLLSIDVSPGLISIQPIPITHSILEKIKGMESNPYNDTYVYDSIVIECRSIDFAIEYWINSPKRLLPIYYLHTLQQLIRLFTKTEIEIEW